MSAQDFFGFDLVGGREKPFVGYISSVDKTAVNERCMVRGSKNIYKKISGTYAVREGLKRRGTADATVAGVIEAFTWNTSLAAILPIQVANNKVQVESAIADGTTLVWYDLQDATGYDDFVFDTWWNDTLKKDEVVWVRGDDNLYMWQGGISTLVSSNTSDVAGIIATMILQAPGSGYVVGNVLTISGGGGTGGTLTVTSVSGTGAITGFTLTTRGSGYSNTVGAATTGGAGTLATITITVATGEIGLSTDAATSGFATSGGSVTINGNTYTYGSVSGTSLLGVAPDPTGEPNGSVVVSTVVTTSNSPTSASDNFTNDFIKVINNRLHVGSYASRLIYISNQDDYTDFSFSNPRIPGEGELLTLDSLGKGIGVRVGNAHIFGGTQDLYIVSYQEITVGSTLTQQTNVDKKTMANLESALNHHFITSVGDDLVWLSQAQELKVYGTFRNLNQPVFPTLSLPVKLELQEQDFTGGHLTGIGEIIYITAPNSGAVWLYQTRYTVTELGNVSAERLWHSPFVWNLSRIVEIDGVDIGYSNANPQSYQMWDTLQWHDDSPSDDPLPYTCILAMAYRQNYGRGERSDLISGDKAYYEGYMSPGSTVQSAVILDYQGSTGVLASTLNSSESLATFFSGNVGVSLGDASLGDNPLGEGISDVMDSQESLPKFRVITDVTPQDCFEYQLRVFSTDVDSRWEILTLGLNADKSNNLPVFIRKS